MVQGLGIVCPFESEFFRPCDRLNSQPPKRLGQLGIEMRQIRGGRSFVLSNGVENPVNRLAKLDAARKCPVGLSAMSVRLSGQGFSFCFLHQAGLTGPGKEICIGMQALSRNSLPCAPHSVAKIQA